MEINCLECAADDVMRDAWELLHDDCNERPRARPRPSSPTSSIVISHEADIRQRSGKIAWL